jgi:hypothetical protein
MDTHDLALAIGGAIGSAVAIFHGVLTQRRMVEPFQHIAAERLPRTIRRLVVALLHFSTFNWFLIGFALVIAAFALGREAKLAIGLLAGSSYLYGALANLWATRGRHIGWVLYATALALIAYGLAAPGT